MSEQKRPMDIAYLAGIARKFAREHRETYLIDISWCYGSQRPTLQFRHDGILEIAPLERFEWRVETATDGTEVNVAFIMIDGVEFFTLCSDVEKAEVMSER